MEIEPSIIYKKWCNQIDLGLVTPIIEESNGLVILNYYSGWLESLHSKGIINDQEGTSLMKHYSILTVASAEVCLCLGFEYCDNAVAINQIREFFVTNSLNLCQEALSLSYLWITNKLYSKRKGKKALEGFVLQVMALYLKSFNIGIEKSSNSCYKEYIKKDSTKLSSWMIGGSAIDSVLKALSK